MPHEVGRHARDPSRGEVLRTGDDHAPLGSEPPRRHAGGVCQAGDPDDDVPVPTRHVDEPIVQCEIDGELEREPARIQRQYEVVHQRLERVGLVYLWPATS